MGFTGPLATTVMDFGTPQFWIAVLEIIAVNILLSGDNAVVIALACRNLSPRRRQQGILWGVLGAIVLRIALTFFAMTLLVNPYLKLIGAALLLWIGVRLIAEEEDGDHKVRASDRLVGAIGTIIITDLVMSLDNVMAVAAAAKGSLSLIVFGLIVSIPIVIIGAQLIVRLLQKFPIVVIGGGGLLGYIAGEMAVEDPAVAPWIAENASQLAGFAPLAAFAGVVVAGTWLTRRRARVRSS